MVFFPFVNIRRPRKHAGKLQLILKKMSKKLRQLKRNDVVKYILFTINKSVIKSTSIKF
jgi:hypothetical protein